MIEQRQNRGFTLIELVVAFGLFSIVMFIAAGALLSLVNLNKKAQAQQSAINNINFALENMARSIRTGSAYRCDTDHVSNFWSDPFWNNINPQDCTDNNPHSQIVFESERGTSSGSDQWGYWLENNSIYTKKTIDGVHIVARITAPEIIIQDMRFYVTGAVAGGEQPLVRIIVKGYAFVSEGAGNNPRRVDFNLQTLASQRKLDI